MKCNKATLADILGIGLTTVDARVREGMPYLMKPGEKESKEWLFDTVEVLDFIMGRAEAAEKRDEAKEAKTKDLIASSELKWIELGDKKKLMVSVEDVRLEWEESLNVCKSGINALPGRLSQTVAVESDPAACQRIIKAECNALLDQMHRDYEAWVAEHPSTPEPDDAF